MKRITILTGAGISAASGLQTFRGSGGLWEGYRVEEVATPEAWDADPEKVLRFYNERRRSIIKAQPNPAHHALRKLEELFDVWIVTQNIDDLHERAGSKQVVHLHGEIRKSQSSADPSLVYPIDGSELVLGEKCELGHQLRPHVVWFGEAVPMMERAAEIVDASQILIVVGTSLAVYPAASLVDFAPRNSAVYVVDPELSKGSGLRRAEFIQEPASSGVPRLVAHLIETHHSKAG